jgi:hypothetical protein
MNADGSGRHSLSASLLERLSSRVADEEPAFSPSGERIAFVSYPGNDNAEIPVLTPTEGWQPGVRAQGRKCEAGGRSKETSAPNGIGTQGLHISDLSVYTGRATELSAEVSLRGSEWTSKASPTVGGSLQ